MKKKTHEQYVEEVNRISPNIEVIGKYIDNKTPILHRCKIDGHIWPARPSNILRGKGCPICKKLKLHCLKVRSHNEYVKMVNDIDPNIEVLGEYVDEKTPILHRCRIDGYEWYPLPDNILRGHGCPQCFIKRSSVIRTKTHEEFLYNVGNATNDIDVIGTYVNANTPILCRCKICGREWSPLPSNILSGHGCPQCCLSFGEKAVSLYFKNNDIWYESQKTFDGCRNKKMLPFDFYIPEYCMCIEYDGLQHFEPIDFFGGEEGFKQRKINDNIKTEFCKQNNIQLLRIRYDEDIESVLDEYLNNTKLIKEVS